MIYLLTIGVIFLGVNLVLSLLIFIWSRKHNPIDKKDKEFIIFVIDMYIQYAKDLDIHSEEQHDKMVEHLETIKSKYFYEENKKSLLKDKKEKKNESKRIN
jgi:hypothetical protein